MAKRKAFACPKCKGTEQIEITITTDARLVERGGNVETDTDRAMDHSHVWDFASPARCTAIDCGYTGSVGDFHRGHKPLSLPAELARVKQILDGFRPTDESIAALCQFILHRIDVQALPVIYDPKRNNLKCPKCDWIGILDGEPQPGKYVAGFRYLEDIVNHRDCKRTESTNGEHPGCLTIQSYYDSGEGYDDGPINRLECGNCLAECSIPANLEIEFE